MYKPFGACTFLNSLTMYIRIKITRLTLIAVLIAAFTSCSKDNPNKPNPIGDGNAIQVINLKVEDDLINGERRKKDTERHNAQIQEKIKELIEPVNPNCNAETEPDCAARMSEYRRLMAEYNQKIADINKEFGEPIATFFWLYNLEEGKVVPPEELNTDKWDIALGVAQNENLANSILINNKITTIGFLSGIGGETLGALLPQAFDTMKEAPDPASGIYLAELDQNGRNRAPNEPKIRISFANDQVSRIGWFATEGANLITRPVKDRTFVLRTTKGKYVKFEMQSIYKDSPPNPTENSERNYLNFRYFLQKDGSRNLDSSK